MAEEFGTSLDETDGTPKRLADRLRYQRWRADEWQPVPGWAQWLVRVGALVAAVREKDSRFVVALAVPTRAYAACFVAAGLVTARADEPPAAELEARLALLRERAPQRPAVTYRPRANMRRPGSLIRCTETEIMLREPKGVLTRIPARDALKIDLAGGHGPRVAKRAMRVRLEPGLLAGLFGNRFGAFLSHSQLDCIVAGTDQLLRLEAEARFGFETEDGQILHGSLQDIIRVRRFTREGDSYRSDVQVLGGLRPVQTGATPPVVIFDGAAHFLRDRDNWLEANWVAILDKTESRYQDALGEVSLLWDTRRLEDLPGLQVPASPNVECSIFAVE